MFTKRHFLTVTLILGSLASAEPRKKVFVAGDVTNSLSLNGGSWAAYTEDILQPTPYRGI